MAHRFHKIAGTLRAAAAAKMGPRLTNTLKRQREAQYAHREGRLFLRAADAFEVLGSLHEAKQVPELLQNVSTKDDVFAMVRTGYDACREHDTGIYADESEAAKLLRSLVQNAQSPASQAQAAAAVRQARITSMEGEVRFLKIPGFFPTPLALADEMADLLDVKDYHAVLEPSAGLGSLIEAVRRRAGPRVQVTAIEYMHKLADIIREKGIANGIITGDFLTMPANPAFDRIIMNPPFESRQDARHILHALGWLKPNGCLVGLTTPTVWTASDSAAVEFRDCLSRYAHERVPIAAGAFAGKDSFRQTGVACEVVVVHT